MNPPCPKRSKPAIADVMQPTTTSESCSLEDMDALHLLAYLLTANHEKAEQSCVTGLENCADNNFRFKEWARSWLSAQSFKSAIRMMSRGPCRRGPTCSLARGSAETDASSKALQLNMSHRDCARSWRLRAVCLCSVGSRAILRSGLFHPSKIAHERTSGQHERGHYSRSLRSKSEMLHWRIMPETAPQAMSCGRCELKAFN